MSLVKRINALEPLWWSLFGIGGAVAAFLLPAHIFIQGIAAPMGWVSPEHLNYDQILSCLQSPFVKIYMFALITFPLFHAAHRIRLTLEDLRFEGLNQALPLLTYGSAIGLTILAVAGLLRI